jgi:transcriptional regulator with XRE-family HTH domain
VPTPKVRYLTRVVPEWTFGDRLRKARLALKLAQGPFADLVAAHTGFPVSHGTVGAWELGTNEPRGAKRQRVIWVLAELTGWAPEWFEGALDGEQPASRPPL